MDICKKALQKLNALSRLWHFSIPSTEDVNADFLQLSILLLSLSVDVSQS